jgi:hypothetical protein
LLFFVAYSTFLFVSIIQWYAVISVYHNQTFCTEEIVEIMFSGKFPFFHGCMQYAPDMEMLYIAKYNYISITITEQRAEGKNIFIFRLLSHVCQDKGPPVPHPEAFSTVRRHFRTLPLLTKDRLPQGHPGKAMLLGTGSIIF